MKLFELLWAWMHRATFYPLVALVLAGPCLTIAAWVCRGRHRLWLVCSWTVFTIIMMKFHYHRAAAMLRVLWWIWMD